MSIDEATAAQWDAIHRKYLAADAAKPIRIAQEDVVNNPTHYNKGGMECIDYIQQQLSPEAFKGYLEGNMLKYVHRHKYKNGMEDLKKAKWYLEKLTKVMSQERNR
tara:strand:- start:3271 stop:3588 length:318 start_codon:yes stop_codon:yes gene_type:complete